MFFKITENKIKKWTQKRQVDKLIKALDDKDVKVQRWAVQALTRLQDMRAIEPLLRVLNNPALRAEIESSFHTFSESLYFMTARVASGFMGDKEKQFVGAVPHLLVAMGKKAVLVSVQQLSHENSTVRLIALTVLGALNATTFVDKIAPCLNDGNPNVREQTAKILNKFGKAVSAPQVMKVINKSSFTFSPDAIKLVRSLKYEPTDKDGKTNYFIAIREFDQALALGEDAISKVVKRFTHPQEAVRKAAANALVKLGQPIVKHVMPMTEKDDWKLRTLAIWTIIQVKDPATVPLLVSQLEEPDSENGQAAKPVLEEFKEQTISYVESVIQKEQAQVPEEAILLIQRMGWKPKTKQARIYVAIIKNDLEAAAREGKEAIPAILRAINQADVFKRPEGIKAMGAIQAPETILALETYLRSSDLYSEKAVVEVYRRIKGKEAITSLINCLDVESPDIQRDIVEALSALGEPKWKKVTTYTPEDLYHYAKLGLQTAINKIVSDLTNRFKSVRVEAAELLVKLAKENPKVLIPEWSSIHSELTSAHGDTHSDERYDRSSDCTHMDNHEDAGIGVAFPQKPPNNATGENDF
jgi:HEAT repeat protein